MGFARVFTISSMLMCLSIVFDVIHVQLPHPACHKRPLPWPLRAEPSALTGDYAANTALQSAKRLLHGKIRGSESVAVSPSGEYVFLADKFGWIYRGRITEDQTTDVILDPPTPFLQLRGRPLGTHAVTETTLLICDSSVGLVEVNLETKTHKVLVSHVKRPHKTKRTSRVVYANDLDVGPDGVVYFTDSTDIPVEKCAEGYYSTMRTYILNLMEGGTTGRLLSYDPSTNKTAELVSNLWYANGVAVERNGRFVAVVETNGLRVHRFWLKGPKTGRSDLMIEKLPGFPDGISLAEDGNFWIALAPPPPAALWVALRHHVTRLLYAWITEYVSLPLRQWGYIVKVTPEGKVLQVLSDIEGGFISSVSSVTERDGKLFLGNLDGDYVSVFDLALLQTSHQESMPTKEEL